MTILLVTGTSTGVGKTITTAAIAAASAAVGRSVAVCKPAQTGVARGEPGDLADIRRLSGVRQTLELARYPDPLAPDTAARRSGGTPLELAPTVAAIDELAAGHDVTLVEGAGGLLVRIGPDFTMIDLAERLSAQVVVVTMAGLGTLNHTELTTRALAAAGVTCAGLVIGSMPAQPDLAARCNQADLPRLTGVDIVGVIPENAGSLPSDTFTAAAPAWFDDTWAAHRLGVRAAT